METSKPYETDQNSRKKKKSYKLDIQLMNHDLCIEALSHKASAQILFRACK